MSLESSASVIIAVGVHLLLEAGGERQRLREQREGHRRGDRLRPERGVAVLPREAVFDGRRDVTEALLEEGGPRGDDRAPGRDRRRPRRPMASAHRGDDEVERGVADDRGELRAGRQKGAGDVRLLVRVPFAEGGAPGVDEPRGLDHAGVLLEKYREQPIGRAEQGNAVILAAVVAGREDVGDELPHDRGGAACDEAGGDAEEDGDVLAGAFVVHNHRDALEELVHDQETL
jgi:hypothetical protein